MTLEGYVTIMLFHFFWKAFEHSNTGQKYYIDTSNFQSIGILEILFRCAMIPIIDELYNVNMVLFIFGTRDIPVLPDFFIRRVGSSFVMATFASSPIDGHIYRLFRKQKDTEKSKVEEKTKVEDEQTEISLCSKAKTE